MKLTRFRKLGVYIGSCASDEVGAVTATARKAWQMRLRKVRAQAPLYWGLAPVLGGANYMCHKEVKHVATCASEPF